MVYEFTELQGVMGYYYALAQKEDEEVALALKEQYMPLGENGELPATHSGAILSLATKLDNLIGLFSTGKVPTGSKDPFALRRAAIGLIRIIVDKQYPLDIAKIITKASKQYNDYDKESLIRFVYDRIAQIRKEVNPSIIHAVLATEDKNITEIFKRIDVMDAFTKRSDFGDLLAIFKRVANITKDFDLSQVSIDPARFETPYEKALFEHVMVNAEDETVRQNRKSLIAAIYLRFKTVADIKEITAA